MTQVQANWTFMYIDHERDVQLDQKNGHLLIELPDSMAKAGCTAADVGHSFRIQCTLVR